MAGEETRGQGSVILDSNFLFIPRQFGVDIFDELQKLLGTPCRCVVPSAVLRELQLLKEDAKPSFRKKIDFALTLAEACDVAEVDLKKGETVDEAIINLAKMLRTPVATNDAELRRRLRAEGIPVIYLRKRTHLEMDGYV